MTPVVLIDIYRSFDFYFRVHPHDDETDDSLIRLLFDSPSVPVVDEDSLARHLATARAMPQPRFHDNASQLLNVNNHFSQFLRTFSLLSKFLIC